MSITRCIRWYINSNTEDPSIKECRESSNIDRQRFMLYTAQLETSLLDLFVGDSSFSGILNVLGLETQFTSTPGSSEVSVVVVGESEVLQQGFEFSLVLLGDILKSNGGSSLLTDELTESCLTLDEAERNVHLSAELGEPDNQFDGVDIVSDDDESSLLLFNELGDVVKTELKNLGSLGFFSLLAFSLSLSSSSKSLLLLGLVFRSVVLQESEEGTGLVSVDGLGELVKCGGDLKSFKKNLLVSLESDVLRPSDRSGEISDGLDITTNSEASGSLLEEGVSLDLIGSLGSFGGLANFLSLDHFLI